MKKAVHSFRENIILTLGIVMFILLFLISFLIYNGFQNNQFKYLESQNQTALVLWQSQKVQTELARVEGQLKAISDMVSASGTYPENDWFQDYLSRLDVNNQYRMEYRPYRIMEQELESGLLSDDAAESYRRLMRGQQVISDIHFYPEYEDYYFVIEEPVVNFGKTIGSIRCMVPAAGLMQQETVDPFPSPIGQYIVDERGDVCYSKGFMDLTGKNMVEGLRAKGVSEGDLEQVRKVIQSDRNAAVFLGGVNGAYIMTCASLNYRGWSLVQFVQDGNMKAVSSSLLHGTIFLVILFVGLTGCSAYMIYTMIGRKNLKLEYQTANYESLARVLDAILFEYQPKTGRMTLSTNAEELLDITSCDIANIRSIPFKAVHDEDMNAFYRLLENAEADKMEIRLRARTGEWLWYECQVQPTIPGQQTEVLAGRIININSRKMRELQLEKKSTADALTGLMNRTAVRSSVEEIWNISPCGFLFMFDVDNFKNVNDSKGHVAGDHILCQIAETLKNSFRGRDPVGRFGGDEFIAYMADCCSREQAEAKAEFIISRLAELSDKENMQVSVSIGISAAPEDGDTFDDLLKKADTALYRAKQQGKTCYCFYSEEEQVKAAEGNQTDE